MKDQIINTLEKQGVTRELSEMLWTEHVLNKPKLDKQMAPLRVKAWEKWKKEAQLNELDARKRAPVYLIHQEYTKEEKELYAKYEIEYCAGKSCGIECKYLLATE